MAEMQFSAIPSADYYVYELVPMSSPGLPGTFVFTGFYSTTNQVRPPGSRLDSACTDNRRL